MFRFGVSLGFIYVPFMHEENYMSKHNTSHNMVLSIYGKI
jgi:hypothetical protein